MLLVCPLSEFPRSTPPERVPEVEVETEVEVEVVDDPFVPDAPAAVDPLLDSVAPEVRSPLCVVVPDAGAEVAGAEAVEVGDAVEEAVVLVLSAGPSCTLKVQPAVPSATHKSAVESLESMGATLTTSSPSQQAKRVNGATTVDSYSKGDPGGAVWVRRAGLHGTQEHAVHQSRRQEAALREMGQVPFPAKLARA